MMWHFAGRFTPQGNIGKYSDEAIEAWLEWDGKPGALIEAFVQTRWLDRDETHRLLVHDWSQHADKATKNALNRAKLDFCTPPVRTPYSETASPYRLPVPEPVPEPVPGGTQKPYVHPPSPAAAFSENNDEAWLIARAVIEGTGITNRWAADQIVKQALIELKENPGDLDGVRDGMIGAWKEYERCAKADKLRTAMLGAEKFFGEGKWKSWKLWGLKKGESAYKGVNGATHV
jgi:hypothetical protein